VPAVATSLIAQGTAVTIYVVTRPTPKPALTIRLGEAAASWAVDVAQSPSPDKETGLVIRATKAKKSGRQAHTFDIKVRTDSGVFTARSGERVALPNRDQAVQVTVAEQGGQSITKTVRVKNGQVTDADVEFTPSRGQVLVTKVGDIAPMLRCSSPRCSVDVEPGTEVKLTAVLGEEATFGGFHQFPMRTPSALVPWLGDPVAQCNAGSALDAAARGDVMDCTIKVKADTDVAADFGEVPERIDVAFTDETSLDKLIKPIAPKVALPPPPIDAEKLEEKPLEVAMIKPPPQIKPPEIKPPPPPPPPEPPKQKPPEPPPNMVMVEVKDDQHVKDKAPDDAKQLSDKNRDVAEETRATKTNLDKESEGKTEASKESDDTKSAEIGGPDDKIRQLEETKATTDQRINETDHSGDKSVATGEIKGESGDNGQEGTGDNQPGILSMRGIGGRGNIVDQKNDGKKIGKKGLPGLNTNMAFQDYERIMGKDKVDDERQVAARKMSSKKGRWERKLDAIKSSLENFVPDVKPGNQTALKTRAHPFALFIARMHRRIHELWGFGFLEDLDEKGANYPLNDPNLWVNLEVSVNPDGTLHKVTIAKTSGKTEFDVAAVDTVISSAPFDATPEAIRSVDGRVYLRWGFYRNWRQCGTFNVEPYILTEVSDDGGAGALDDGAMVANVAKVPGGKKHTLPPGANDKPVTPDDGQAKQKVNPDSNVNDKQALFAANLWVSAFATASVDKLVKYSAVPFYAAGKVAATTQADLKDMYSGLVVESGPMKDWKLLSANEYTSGSQSLPDGNVVLQVRTAKESFAVVLTRTPSGDYRATQIAR
jgi:TonB family protein